MRTMSSGEPTKAAMRAAKAYLFDVGIHAEDFKDDQLHLAEIIDRETGLPELIEAALDVPTCGCKHPHCKRCKDADYAKDALHIANEGRPADGS